ncbi:MAG: hypothetical protein K6G81_10835 [Lachnospiraceae bacterium]|nr:hypothetical protein [Lachnospiraceae bacterium]
MNIYRFINSKDIRKHLEDLNYGFNALEAAWLVYQCRNAVLDEKNEAWRWIIDNMPDMEVRAKINCSYRESIHDTLRVYMEMNDDILEMFSDPRDAVYTCRYYENGSEVGVLRHEREVFFSLDDCIKAIRAFLDDDETDTENRCSYNVTAIRHFRDKDMKIIAKYDSNCRVIALDVYNNPNDKYDELLTGFFDGLWFDFPTPFKKGDLVHKVGDDLRGHAFGLCSGVCVLTSLFTWGLTDEEKRKHYTEGRSGDITDMTYYGYFQDEDGTLYHECSWTYMDLEYHREPLEGVQRVCKALSSLLKDEIDIGLFSLANRQFILEKQEEIIKEHCHFTEEDLRLAGLIDSEQEG